MRRLAVAMTMMVLAQGAQAADVAEWLNAPLRGSVREAPLTPRRWDGFYIGGQAATGAANMNFAGATNNLVHHMLLMTTIENEMNPSTWPIMGRTSSAGTGLGGFAGYNWQWDDAVLSIEASYLHTRFQSSATGNMGRQMVTSDGYNNAVDVTGNASMIIHDMASLRFRGAYATGNFLPYMFAGVSLGLADLTRGATVSAVGTYVGPNVPPPPNYAANYNEVDQQNNQAVYGYAFGFGLDYKLFSNVFLRGEYEYLRFATPVDVQINTIRGGVGVRF